MSLEQELANYLQQDGFERFIEVWIEKYKSLGHLGGQIYLKQLTDRERSAISGLLGIDLLRGDLKITYRQFQKQLSYTRFEGVDFLKVIEILKNQKIYSKKEMQLLYEQKLFQFKEDILYEFSQTKANLWLESYFNQDRFVKRYFAEDQTSYKQILQNVCHALNQLPCFYQDYELLAVFAQTITKNPHYFDEDLPRDLLLKGICFLLKLDIAYTTSENVTEIFYQAGILRDDLSNYCYICHIQPQEKIISWQGFYENYEPWNMNLYNVNQIQGSFQKSDIYIFENPSVFRSLCTFAFETQLPIGLMSSNGQINLSTYLLLNRLVESGCHLYYAGDFDPEGLVIADKLKQKYAEHLTLWHYDLQYFNDIHVHQIDIAPKRLQMLQSLQTECLKCIAYNIEKTSSFGYQEGLISVYKDSLFEKYKQ